MPNVYILLTRTDTVFAQALHGVSGSRYTHASLSLDRELTRMYSFARRYEAFPLPSGFIKENIYAGVFGRCGGADSLLLELPVSHGAYAAIERRLAVMERASLAWQYDIMGLALAAMGIAHERPYKYFCSQFVADTLEKAGALRLPCHASLVRPQDFAYMPGLRRVYQGPLAHAADCRQPLPGLCVQTA